MSFNNLLAGFFGSLPRFAIRAPRRALLLTLLVTLAALPGLRHLKLRTDAHALVPPGAPEVAFDKSIRQKFGIEDQMVVLVQSHRADGIFNPATLQLVRDLTSALARLPGINPANLMSLATEPSFRLRPGTLMNQKLLEPSLNTGPELEQLRDDLRRIELYTGTLVSFDGRATAILLGVPAEADRPALYQQVLGIIAMQRKGTDEIFVSGAPVAEALLGNYILEDLGVPRKLLGADAASRAEAARIPASVFELRAFIARRIGLAPVAGLVMLVVLLIAFRNLPAALAPLPGVAATLAFVFGFMGWLGVPIYLTIAVMPVLLIAVGVTNDIYLFNRYFTLLREKPGVSHVALVEETFAKLVCPVAGTSLTSAVGFLSFGFSPMEPVRAFGMVTGIGVLFGLFYSLTAVPAMLVLLNPAWFLSGGKQPPRSVPSPLAGGFARLARTVVRRRWAAAGLILLITALTPLGLRRLTVQDSWMDSFDPAGEFRRTARLINGQFHGIHLLYVSFDAPRTLAGELAPDAVSPGALSLPAKLLESPATIAGGAAVISFTTTNSTAGGGGSNFVWQSHVEMVSELGDIIFARLAAKPASPGFWEALPNAGRVHYEIVVRSHTRPQILRELRELGAFIRQRRERAVGAVLGPPDYLITTRFMVRPNDPEARQLVDDSAQIKVLWDYYGLALGTPRLRQLVDTNYWQSLTTVFLKDANFVDTAGLVNDIRDFERRELTPQGIKIGFAGDVAVSQSLIQGIVRTQLQSLFGSLAGIFLITALFGGSLRWGFYCLLPSILAVLVKFAVMGWMGIPLGVATSMFAAMTLGIGVNCAIHLLEACRQARVAGASPEEALIRSLALSGPPALVNTLSVSFGFGVLMLSQVPANARLGVLLVLGLVNCFVASVLLLPVLLSWWPLEKDRQ